MVGEGSSEVAALGLRAEWGGGARVQREAGRVLRAEVGPSSVSLSGERTELGADYRGPSWL